MVRVRLWRKLRKSLKELTEDALCSPEKFVPEPVLGKWYKEYVSEVGDGETPVERDSSNFNEWSTDARRTKLKNMFRVSSLSLSNFICNSHAGRAYGAVLQPGPLDVPSSSGRRSQNWSICAQRRVGDLCCRGQAKWHALRGK
jgi:hypothetical protein